MRSTNNARTVKGSVTGQQCSARSGGASIACVGLPPTCVVLLLLLKVQISSPQSCRRLREAPGAGSFCHPQGTSRAGPSSIPASRHVRDYNQHAAAMSTSRNLSNCGTGNGARVSSTAACCSGTAHPDDELEEAEIVVAADWGVRSNDHLIVHPAMHRVRLSKARLFRIISCT